MLGGKVRDSSERIRCLILDVWHMCQQITLPVKPSLQRYEKMFVLLKTRIKSEVVERNESRDVD